MIVKELSLLECLFELGFGLPPLGNFMVRSALKKDGTVLGACLNEGDTARCVGLAVVNSGKALTIDYVFVPEEYRGRGYGTKLVAAATTLAKEREAVGVRARAVMVDPSGEVFAQILERNGFEVYDRARLVSFADDDRTRTAWQEFVQDRAGRICAKLKDRGYWTVSFADASPEVLQHFQEDVKQHFPPHLNPNIFLNNREHRLAADHSFIALKGDECAAYTLVTTIDGKTLSFQQLSASRKHQRSGAFLLPVVATVETAFAKRQYKLMSAMVYDSNENMNRLVDGFIAPLATSIKTQRFYRLLFQEHLPRQECHGEGCQNESCCTSSM